MSRHPRVRLLQTILGSSNIMARTCDETSRWPSIYASSTVEYQMMARFFPYVNLDSYANEVLLLHGTHQSSATKIMQQGFDQRLAQRRLYGRGTYFTAESCKARQVGKRHHDTSCIILARVVLGHPFMAEGPMTKHERPTFQFELRKLPQKKVTTHATSKAPTSPPERSEHCFRKRMTTQPVLRFVINLSAA